MDKNNINYQDIILEYNKSNGDFTVVGSGYSFLIQNTSLDNHDSKKIIKLSHLNKILELNEVKMELTVQAGVKLYKINNYLRSRNFSLLAYPEFLGVSAGACVKTPIHGSNKDIGCISDTIVCIKYIENGLIKKSRKNDENWSKIFFNFKTNLIILEVTFSIIHDEDINCQASWINESALTAYLKQWCPMNLESYIVTWYLKKQTALLFEMYRDKKPNYNYFKATQPYKYIRFIPYIFAKLIYIIMPHRKAISSKKSCMLTGWNELSFFEKNITKLLTISEKRADIEFSVSFVHGVNVFNALNSLLSNHNLSLGIRIGSGDSIWHDEKFFWFEVPHCPVSLIFKLEEAIKIFNPKFHTGKVSPNEFHHFIKQ